MRVSRKDTRRGTWMPHRDRLSLFDDDDDDLSMMSNHRRYRRSLSMLLDLTRLSVKTGQNTFKKLIEWYHDVRSGTPAPNHHHHYHHHHHRQRHQSSPSSQNMEERKRERDREKSDIVVVD